MLCVCEDITSLVIYHCIIRYLRQMVLLLQYTVTAKDRLESLGCTWKCHYDRGAFLLCYLKFQLLGNFLTNL